MTKQNDWVSEFDKRFPTKFLGDAYDAYYEFEEEVDPYDIKDFIRTIEAEAYNRGCEDTKNVIRKMQSLGKEIDNFKKEETPSEERNVEK